MKKVILCGAITEKFGAEFELNVKTPYEALNALEANFPGFLSYVDEHRYVVSLIDLNSPESAEHLSVDNALTLWEDQTLFIIPTTEGEITAAMIAAIAGPASATSAAVGISAAAATAAVSTTVATAIAAVVNIAISIAVSAIVSLISSAITNSGKHEGETEDNYVFTGVVNTTKQGGRMPILYGGPMMCGSRTLSGRIATERQLSEKEKTIAALRAEHPEWFTQWQATQV